MDQSKRNSIKLMGSAGILAYAASASSVAATRLFEQAGAVDIDALPLSVPRSNAELEIQIISSSAIPENSIIIRNATDSALSIEKFMPGHIVFNDRIVNINSIFKDAPIVLEASQVVSIQAEIWELLAMPPVEFVWAEHAIEKLSHETDVITLGAFMSDSNAVMFPMPLSDRIDSRLT